MGRWVYANKGPENRSRSCRGFNSVAIGPARCGPFGGQFGAQFVASQECALDPGHDVSAVRNRRAEPSRAWT